MVSAPGRSEKGEKVTDLLVDCFHEIESDGSCDRSFEKVAARFMKVAPKLEGDIKQIVPPILKMSRKLQQDPEYLKTHPWFAYLKPLPKADQMWEGNKKIQ